eukprot:647079-Rhodomonas_salina.3
MTTKLTGTPSLLKLYLCFGRSSLTSCDVCRDAGRGKDVSVTVEHSLGVRPPLALALSEPDLTPTWAVWQAGGTFKARCKLMYSALRSSGLKAKRTVSVKIDQTTFSPQDLAMLQELVDAGKHYVVRIPSDVNNPDSPKVSASVPACLLAASDFHEIFRVHVDAFGHIRGLWYQTMALACPLKLELPQVCSAVSIAYALPRTVVACAAHATV